MSDKTYYVQCATQEERDSLLDYAVKRGATKGVIMAGMPDVILRGGQVWATKYLGTKPTQLTPDSFRRKVRKLWPSKDAKRKSPKPSPKTRKPSQLDRIEAKLSQVHEELLSVRSIANHARTAARVNTGKLDTIQRDLLETRNAIITETNAIDETVDTIIASLSQPTAEQAAPQPMSTTRIDIDKELADKARVIAKTEHPCLVGHVNLLIEEDLRKRQRKTRKP